MAGVCTSCGDAITQLSGEAIEITAGPASSADEDRATTNQNASNFDLRRNLAFTAFGMVWSVPGRIFYNTLARYVPTDTLTGAIKGALIGELGMDIPISLPTFFISTDIMRGRDMDFIKGHMQRDYTTCAASSFCLWAPATVVNLRLVPLQYRVIFDSVFVVLWNAWLSFQTNRTRDM